ncbi:MAG TPA: hypothetical protein ENF61_02370 [Firmicutes bacterium]|nr:MAG: hypothetical protein DRP67_04730 [Candidatus Omnitrophota bacterium]HDD64940.1 hypothetical protein [Bacillota bacterium]
MNRNLKVLDKFDNKVNIYELIVDRAERAHNILNGAPPLVNIKEDSITQIVMEEVLSKEK